MMKLAWNVALNSTKTRISFKMNSLFAESIWRDNCLKIESQEVESFQRINHGAGADSLLNFQVNQHLKDYLIGKQLLEDELPFSKKEIEVHKNKGFIHCRKGIIFEHNKPKCVRCGNNKPHLFASFPCSRCKKECIYCRNCIQMGRVSSCTPLLSWNISYTSEHFKTNPSKDNLFSEIKNESLQNLSINEEQSSFLHWEGTLSESQQLASSRVVEAIMKNEDLLLWAVCGAGKTEVLFQGIEKALGMKKRICIATPRTDVVLELTPRLQSAFPDIDISSLYGGSPDRHKFSPLTIATTHQLLRFYQAFDVVILDEVDAFPYSIDETLQYAVLQARKKVSSMIYLTATPSESWQKECRLGKRNYVTIPARYHGNPLPVPKFAWCGNWQKHLTKGKLPINVEKWIQKRVQERKQALIFIPKIALLEQTLQIIRQIEPTAEGVHADDPKRKEKVQKMRNKEILFLVTTTILERGVTFPNIDVAVLGAEDRIFTESALVQIAGRVGRSALYPNGEAIFFHFGKTEAMEKARKQIMTMNQEAYKKGFIDRSPK